MTRTAKDGADELVRKELRSEDPMVMVMDKGTALRNFDALMHFQYHAEGVWVEKSCKECQRLGWV